MRTHLYSRAILVLILISIPGLAQAKPSPGDLNTFRPAAASGTSIIPDKWLQRWDPVTVFFSRSEGPVDPTPADNPEKYVHMEPAHPGGWRWLNSRTLQFTPAQPWPAFSSFLFEAGGTSTTLHTVLQAPTKTQPEHGETDTLPVETVKLIFPAPIDQTSLASHVKLHLWDAPAADGSPRQILNSKHFSIKRIGVDKTWGKATYLLTLHNPIPNSTRVKLYMDLTDQKPETKRFVLDFTTSRYFSLLAAGAENSWIPLSYEGGSKRNLEPLSLTTNPPVLNLRMTSAPEPITPGAFWDLLHIAPAVQDVEFIIKDRIIEVTGKFIPDKIYTATLRPTDLLRDNRDRKLHLENALEFQFVFKKPNTMLKWKSDMVLIERYGAKMLPLKGRGNQIADLRIHRIDPLDRTLWPFRSKNLSTDPDQQPPGWSQNQEYHDQAQYTDTWQLKRTLKTLGSPQISELLELPLNPMGKAGVYGINIENYLRQIDGKNAPGAYLAGIQSVNDSGSRQWIRFQVTDLALTTIEEPDQVTFLVTSLASARPVAKAGIIVEGFQNSKWKRLYKGKTDVMGACVFTRSKSDGYFDVKRIRVEKGNDILVCDADKSPQVFRNGYWSNEGDWLFSVINYPSDIHRKIQIGHVFTERPVYKPGEPVHIRGWLRQRKNGKFDNVSGSANVVIDGPGGLNWTEKLELSRNGGFYLRFDEEFSLAGVYNIRVNSGDRYACDCTFRMEDYRIPRFEVLLHGPDRVALDAPFDVSMTASYYAGGAMVEQPINWQVTQHPESWSCPGLPGFQFADDDRFTGRPGIRHSDVLSEGSKTDKNGTGKITINPLEDPALESRVYVVEATVTGVDDQRVTAVKEIKATPAFLLGVKAPRILKPGEEISAEIAVLDSSNVFQADREVLVRLVHRTWHTVLKAGNYSSGDIKYDTHIVETMVDQKTVMSMDAPLGIHFPAREAGVYVVEASAHDRLGRAQIVAMDVFVQGESPVAWERPSDRRFTIKTGKPKYKPGETAEIILESPFQTAEVVAVVESQEKTRLIHTSVRNGTGIIRIPVKKEWCPGIPISVLLMRGRLPSSKLDPSTGIDLGKPQTLGASIQLYVSDAEYRINIDVNHPERALPGETINLSLALTDENKQPLSGEAVVWLVDRAVMALGRELRPDPLKDILSKWPSYSAIRDTREYTVGKLPWVEKPGGGYGAAFAPDLSMFDRLSIRKNFKAVPYYNPFVDIGEDGKVQLSVELPDNLTQFAVKVKAASCSDKFGFSNSRLTVSLPLVLQPTVPRFIRPGDSFNALAISRLVEGDNTTGRVAISVDGLNVSGSTVKDVNWELNKPIRTSFTVDSPEAQYDTIGQLLRKEILLKLAAEPLTGGAGDAAEITIPMRDGARLQVTNQLNTIKSGESISIPEINLDEIREETSHRSIWISTDPLITLALSAESLLRDYPYGCTEQRVSRANGYILLTELAEILGRNVPSTYSITVQETVDYIHAVITPENLVSFWPGDKGYVFLSARVLRFLAKARMAGYDVDPVLLEQLGSALTSALRSDSDALLSKYAVTERCLALEALSTIGQLDTGYLEELLRNADILDLESRARITRLLTDLDGIDPGRIDSLAEGLLDHVIIKTINGEKVATGLTSGTHCHMPWIFQTDITTLAEIIRTIGVVNPTDPRISYLINGMVNMLSSRTMSTFYADSMLTVLRDSIVNKSMGRTAELKIDNKHYSIDDEMPLIVLTDNGKQDRIVELVSGSPITVQVESRGFPKSDPAELPSVSHGFAVNRSWHLLDETGHIGKKLDLNEPKQTIKIQTGTILEEHIQVTNGKDRYYVVVNIPLAAGIEPLNPALATTSSEAIPEGSLTLTPDYMELRDDHVAYYYNELPRGSYDFYFRGCASFSGDYCQPGAWASMMYSMEETGASPGVTISIND